jgi:DNA-binding response OmpR family regulator
MKVPGLLLIEDDATSAAFLGEALASLPAQVDVAGDIAQACALARAKPHSLWLVDAHLPDGGGLDCLRALRAVHAGGGRDTPALAITAGAPREELDALCAGGFLEVLLKPVSIGLLHATVRRLLGDAGGVAEPAAAFVGGGKLPVWERDRALAAIGGNAGSLAKLRSLFLQELPLQRDQLQQAQAGNDAGAIAALLHKLRASCGFVGAARLARAVEALSRAPLDAAALRDFGHAVDDTLGAADQS